VDTSFPAPAAAVAEHRERSSVDRAAFAAKIWNPPPAPPAAQPPAPASRPAPPPRLQLVGIVRDVDDAGEITLRAALYDPDTDRLHVVACGEMVGGVAVASIDSTGISLEAGGRRSRLGLREERGGGPP
jgi:hypothetical protein